MTNSKKIHVLKSHTQIQIVFNRGAGVDEGQHFLRKTNLSIQFHVKLQSELYIIVKEKKKAPSEVIFPCDSKT